MLQLNNLLTWFSQLPNFNIASSNNNNSIKKNRLTCNLNIWTNYRTLQLLFYFYYHIFNINLMVTFFYIHLIFIRSRNLINIVVCVSHSLLHINVLNFINCFWIININYLLEKVNLHISREQLSTVIYV